MGRRPTTRPRQQALMKPERTGEVLQAKATGGVLTAKQAPHRPGTAPALGLRAGCDVAAILIADQLRNENEPCHSTVGCRTSAPPSHRARANVTTADGARFEPRRIDSTSNPWKTV